jgi:hypothetical protein
VIDVMCTKYTQQRLSMSYARDCAIYSSENMHCRNVHGTTRLGSCEVKEELTVRLRTQAMRSLSAESY